MNNKAWLFIILVYLAIDFVYKNHDKKSEHPMPDGYKCRIQCVTNVA